MGIQLILIHHQRKATFISSKIDHLLVEFRTQRMFQRLDCRKLQVDYRVLHVDCRILHVDRFSATRSFTFCVQSEIEHVQLRRKIDRLHFDMSHSCRSVNSQLLHVECMQRSKNAIIYIQVECSLESTSRL